MISQQPNVAIREKLIGKLMEAPNTAVGVGPFSHRIVLIVTRLI